MREYKTTFAGVKFLGRPERKRGAGTSVEPIVAAAEPPPGPTMYVPARAESVTDAQGYARATWTLGSLGAQALREQRRSGGENGALDGCVRRTRDTAVERGERHPLQRKFVELRLER